MSTISADALLNETKRERNERFKNQLYQAAAKGVLQGTLIALMTGYALSYKYNHGVNRVFQNNLQSMVVCWVERCWYNFCH